MGRTSADDRHLRPVSCLSDPQVIRAALDGLCVRLDGSPAAANTITRKRAVFHNALGYAVELGLLPANPAGTVQWHAPKAAVAVSPQTVASPAQVQAILAQVALMRPDLVAFFAYLYYAALRPWLRLAIRAAGGVPRRCPGVRRRSAGDRSRAGHQDLGGSPAAAPSGPLPPGLLRPAQEAGPCH